MRRASFRGFIATLSAVLSIAVIGAAALFHATSAHASFISPQDSSGTIYAPDIQPDIGLRNITLNGSPVISLDDGLAVSVLAGGDITIYAPNGLITTDFDTSMVAGTVRVIGSAPSQSPGFCDLCPTGNNLDLDVDGAITLIAAFPLGDVKLATPGDLTIFFRPFDDDDGDDANPVPEPSVALLYGLGLAMLGYADRRSQR